MSVDTKYGEAIFKQTQEVAEMFKAAMPSSPSQCTFESVLSKPSRHHRLTALHQTM